MKNVMDNLIFRISSVVDIDDLMSVERECFTEGAWPRSYLEAMLLSETDVSMIVMGGYLGGHIAGYGACHVFGSSIMIDTIGVLSRFCGRGIGTDFLLLFDEFGRFSRCDEMELQVRVDNVSAIRLYEDIGLNIVSVLRGYYEESGKDAFLMRGKLPIRYSGCSLRKRRVHMAARLLLGRRN